MVSSSSSGRGPTPTGSGLVEPAQSTTGDGAGPAATRPTILVLANRLPFPLDDGWKVRAYYILRSLSALGPTTLLITHPADDPAVEDARAALHGSVTISCLPSPRAYSPLRLAAGLLTPVPIHTWNQLSVTYARAVRRTLRTRPFNVGVAVTAVMHPYLRLLPKDALRVIDTHNVDSVTMSRYSDTMHGLKRWYARTTAARFRQYERSIWRKADRVWVCSSEEESIVRAVVPSAGARVVPNGVDTKVMAPLRDVPIVPNRILFFGRLDYYPNVDALLFFTSKILPILRQRDPDTRIVIVGQGAGPKIKALAERNPELQLWGRVDDLRPALSSAAVVAVPLRVGGGTRLKILEALSMAKAVVSTRIGAEGLDLKPERDIILADNADDFATALLSVLRDGALARALGEAGRRAVIDRYDWRNIGTIVADELAYRTGNAAPPTGET